MKYAIIAALALSAAPAFAEDNQAGTPLSPGEAAGAWTVQTDGHDVCVLTLRTERSGAGYAVNPPATCHAVLPGRPVAWRPTADGMELLKADGTAVLSFNRWSNSLFVAHRGQRADVQLRRGGFEG